MEGHFVTNLVAIMSLLGEQANLSTLAAANDAACSKDIKYGLLGIPQQSPQRPKGTADQLTSHLLSSTKNLLGCGLLRR